MGKLANDVMMQTDGEKGGVATVTKPSVAQRLKQAVDLLSQAVKERDTRALVGRVLRETNALKHELTPVILTAFLKEIYPKNHRCRLSILSHLTQVCHRAEVQQRNGCCHV